MKNLFYSFVFVAFISNIVYAQEHAVRGVIHTLDSIPLIGVDVKVKSTKQTVQTDSTGQFVVFCNYNDKLKITANGFFDENIKIKDKIKLVAINMRLKPGEKQRQYAIGYGYVSEEDLTSSVSNMNKNDSRFSRYKDMLSLLRSTGAEIRNGQVIIRGSKTFQGSEGALIVIDDIISDYGVLNSISPLDVKSVNIIKDGTSAVYGSRGANGVVIIETNKGN